MPLNHGIPINQSPPSVYRANRRPLYMAIGITVLVSLLLVWAWIVRSNMKVLAQAKPTSSTASPATTAMKTLDKQWSEKLPQAQETLTPLVPLADAQAAQTAQGFDARRAVQSFAMPAFAEQQLPQIPGQQLPQAEQPNEERAAWDSPMVPSRQSAPQPQEASAQMPTAAPYSQNANGQHNAADEYLSQNLQDSKKAFAGVGRNTVLPIVADGERPMPYTVKSGWDIPAILEQSANSDLPGELRARVRESVYDTATGRYLLIPQNSILAGKYNSDVAYAQNRVQVNWDRLIRPGNEPTIFLNQMNGVDDTGAAGLTGPVNNHFRRLIGFALLSSAFSAGIEVSQTRNYERDWISDRGTDGRRRGRPADGRIRQEDHRA